MSDPSDDASVDLEPALPDLPTPTLPPAQPIVPTATEEELFDAKSMVAATTPHVAQPAYGALPESTPEGLEAQQKLRAAARRKRQRNRVIAWAVLGVFVAGIAAAGWFAYQAYQDDQDRQRAERAAEEAEREAGAGPGALTPLGEQQQIIEAMDDLNSSDVRPSSGGLRDFVDDAQAAVDDINDAAEAPASAEFEIRDVLPAGALEVATRLDDVGGFERYVVDVDAWFDADPSGFRIWLDTMRSVSQPSSDVALDLFPVVRPGQAGIAIQRDGDALGQAVVRGVTPALFVVIS